MNNLFGKENVTEEAIKKDRELFKGDLNFKLWLAVCYRVNIKEIYLVQLENINKKLASLWLKALNNLIWIQNF